MSELNSAFYEGTVRHRRFSPKTHCFSYTLYMLALDLDELTTVAARIPWFGLERFALISWYRKDYLRQQPSTLTIKEAVWQQALELGADPAVCFAQGKVIQLGNLRCAGFYFSPVNFYYCFDKTETPSYLLAEVTNTPWLEQHYYLIDIKRPQAINKNFPVSPFMDLDMSYHWRISVLGRRALIHIENWLDHKIFDATLCMQRQPLTPEIRFQLLRHWPVMTLKVIIGIYWQALTLLMKRVPFYGHVTRRGS